LDASDTRKYAIYRIIKDILPKVKDLNGLEDRLRSEGVGMRYRLDASGQRLGVSFLYQNEAFRGSEIDKGLSLPGLERAITRRQALSQWEEQKLAQGNRLEEERLRKEQETERDQEALRQREALKQQETLKQQEALKQEEALKQGEALKQKEVLTQKQKLAEVPRQQHRPRLRIH
jgi:hypothetical protein